MAGNDVILVIKADNRATKELKSVGKQTDQLGSKFKTMGKAGAAAFAVAATAAAAYGVKSALSFSKSQAQVRTLISVTDQEFQKLNASTLKFAGSMNIAAADASKALYDALSGGVQRSEVIPFLEAAAAAAHAGGASLTESVGILVQAQNVYGSTVLSAAEASDVLFEVIRGGITTLPELGAVLGRVLPTAAALGVSFQDVGSSLSVMTSRTADTAGSVTRLNALFVAALRDSSKLAKGIKAELGGSFRDLIAKGQTTSEIMQSLRDKLPYDEFLQLFRRVEALNGALLITGDQNAPAVAAAFENMTNAAGATKTAFDKVAESAGFKVDSSFNELKIAMLSLAEVGLPLIVKVVTKITDIIVPAIALLKDALGLEAVASGPMLASDPQFRTAPVIAQKDPILGRGNLEMLVRIGALIARETILKTPQELGLAGAEKNRASVDDIFQVIAPSMPGFLEQWVSRSTYAGITRLQTEKFLPRLGYLPIDPLSGDQNPLGGVSTANWRQTASIKQGLRPERETHALQVILDPLRDFVVELTAEQRKIAALWPDAIHEQISEIDALNAGIAAYNTQIASNSAALSGAFDPAKSATESLTKSMYDQLVQAQASAAALDMRINLEDTYNQILEASTEELAHLNEALQAAIESGIGLEDAQEAYEKRLAEMGKDWDKSIEKTLQDIADAQAKADAEAERKREEAHREMMRINAIQVRLASKSIEEVAGSQELIGMTKKQMAVIYEASGLNTQARNAAQSGIGALTMGGVFNGMTDAQFAKATGQELGTRSTGAGAGYARIASQDPRFAHLSGQVARTNTVMALNPNDPNSPGIIVSAGGKVTVVNIAGNYIPLGPDTGDAVIEAANIAKDSRGTQFHTGIVAESQ
jgi:TP901 family phage tail tape measure protein